MPWKKILDDLGSIVAELKGKNAEINVKVCELVPSLKENGLQDRVSSYNIKMQDWCEQNGISVIRRMITLDLEQEI